MELLIIPTKRNRLYLTNSSSTNNRLYLTNSSSTNQLIEDNDDVPDVPELLTNINQINLCIDEVKSTLTKLSTAKSTGRDQIQNIIFKNSAGIISEQLTFLYNRSLNEGISPTDWKTTHVTPIHKKGNKEQCTNYRPISLLTKNSVLTTVLYLC